MNSHVKMKTLAINVNNIDQQRIFRHMSKISKNIYNTTIFCANIYMEYKLKIFEEIYQRNIINKCDIEKSIYEIYEQKYIQHIKNIPIIKNNNGIIYKYINIIFANVSIGKLYLVNDNYEILRHSIIRHILADDEIICYDDNKNDVVTKIVDDILKSIYNKNFYLTKYQINNKIPCTIKDKDFIGQVARNEKVIKDEKKVDWKGILNGKLLSETKLISDENIVARFVYRHLDENLKKLPSDLIINIIKKAYSGYKSFYGLRAKGIKCNFPKYLEKNGSYILPFFNRSFKVIDGNKQQLRLTVGKYVADNYPKIVLSNELLCMNKDEPSDYKKYVNACNMKKYDVNKIIDKKKFSKNNYLTKSNDNHDIKYISKNSKNIIDAYYTYFNMPSKLKDKKIKLVEIKPIYDGYKYKLYITYEDIINDIDANEISNKQLVNNSISIDLGVKALMTIYNPSGEQRIIDGNYIIWLNDTYNKKIDHIKSNIKKINNTGTSKKIRNLLIKRENKINDYFNKIVCWIRSNYMNKKTMIIGYNENWKTEVNMGNKMNRRFYQIPYSKLLNKLTDNLPQYGIKVVINEESYTSKCDALGLEEVKKHNTYFGKRIKRGLFSSSVNKLINADLNGAINIMRKYFIRIGYELFEITGHNLYNPRRVSLQMV